MDNDRIIMHIDANSAFLSWTAVYELQKGADTDLREIPSAVGGNQSERKGIILAKSTPAKKMGVETGEPIWQAKMKCPDLIIVPPDYSLYMNCSNALYKIVQEYFYKVQRFSIDEIFGDYTGMVRHFGNPIEAAYTIKERIKKELGFTVNIGIGNNKLLSKMAGELRKPDMVHTIFKDEIQNKMWPLPVRELFMVGEQTEKKLKILGINTIGDLAKANVKTLEYKLKSHGRLIWQYANGIENSPVHNGYYLHMKGMGNSTTTKHDIDNYSDANKILLGLTESVCERLRASRSACRVVSVEIKTSEFFSYSHQKKLFIPTDITSEIYCHVKELFKEAWKGEKIRHLGVRVSDLCCSDIMQLSLFDIENAEKKRRLDIAIDIIRNRYGHKAIMRGIFADHEMPPVIGGAGADSYPVMSSIL